MKLSLPSFFRGWPVSSAGGHPSAGGAASPEWPALHDLLTKYAAAPAVPPDELPGLITYHYCAYETAGRPSAGAALVQQLFAQLSAFNRPEATYWLARPVQASALAWLSQRLPQANLAAAPAWLPELDELLYGEAVRLARQLDADSRHCLTQLLRYLRLRLPATRAHLARLLTLDSPPPAQGTWHLGLTQGLTSELLGLLRLHGSGLGDAEIQRRVQQGIRQLLALRHQTDFLEGTYNVFPHGAVLPRLEPVFGTELSWRRGDLGAALLLHHACNLLGDAELRKIAELVGLNTLLRQSEPATGLVTASVYEGAAGVAYLYRRLHQLSGRTQYQQGYQFWLSQARHWLARELAAPGLAPVGNLLYGLAGIGLVLLSGPAEAAPDWDDIIL